MDRREFIAGGAALGLASAVSADGAAACGDKGGCSAMPHFTPPAQPAELNLCLQLWVIPVGGDYNAKLDWLENNGFAAVEIPSGDWLFKETDKFMEAMKGRRLASSSILVEKVP